MKKKLSIALTGALAIGLAVPALAETTFSGTLTVMPMISYDKDGGLFQKDGDEIKPIDQRFRFTMTNKVNDFVTVAWQTEIDTPWGYKTNGTATAKYGSTGYGAALGTDGINLETKHLYMAAKIPDTAFALKAGLQSVKDSALGGLYFWYDVGALLFDYNQDALAVKFGIMKPGQDTPADELWTAMVGYKLSDTLALNLDLFYYDFDEGSDNDYVTVGVGALAKVADIDVDAGIGFQSGDEASGMLLNVGAKAKVSDISVGGRVLYVADDDSGEQWRFITETPLSGEGLNFFGFSGNANFSLGRYAITDSAAVGSGLLGLIVNASVPVDAYTIKGAIGYFQATDEDVVGADGASLGTELGLSVSRKLAEKVDVSLIAGYAILGDYYNGSAAGGEDPDNPYLLGVRIVAPF